MTDDLFLMSLYVEAAIYDLIQLNWDSRSTFSLI